MEFADKLKEFCVRVKNLRTKIKTEEATKTSLIMPFFSLLGYDVFNPLEFIPEYTADVGIKNGEKVDYAIVDKKQNPIILVEAKFCGENLSKHGGQLFRYFATTSAKFEKSSFNISTVTTKANELRYNDNIRQFLLKQLSAPDDGFIAYVMSDIYKGRKTQRVIEDFRPLVKRAFTQIVNDKANERLKSAIDTEVETQDKNIAAEPKSIEPQPVAPALPDIDKLEVFFMIKAFLYDCLNGRNLTYKGEDKQLKILLDDDAGKWLCRIDYETNTFYINLQSGDKEFTKRQFRSIENIYSFKNLLCQAAQKLSD